MTGNTTYREQGRAVFLAAIMVLSMVAMSATFVGAVAAQDVTDADRSVDSTTLAPGASTQVTVDVTFAESTDAFVSESFDPDFAGATIIDDDGADFSDAATDELFASYAGVSEATLVYEVTVPADAEDGDTFEISSDESSDVEIESTTITVDEDEEPEPPEEVNGDRQATFNNIGGDRFWAGQEVAVSGFNNEEVVEIWATDDDSEADEFRRQRTANEDGEILLRTGNLNPDDDYVLVRDNGQVSGEFFITEQTLDVFEFDDDEINSGDTTELEIESNRATGYELNLSADNLDEEDLEDIFGDAVVNVDSDDETVTIEVGSDEETFDADFDDIDADDYTLEAEVTDSTAAAEADISVGEEPDTDVELVDDVEIDQGGIGDIELDISGEPENIGIVIGDDEVGYESELIVKPDGAEEVTVSFNSYRAGANDSATVTAEDEDGDEVEISHYDEVIGDDLDTILADDVAYDLDIGLTDDLEEVRDNPDELGLVFVDVRNAGEMNLWRANANEFDDIDDAEDIEAAVENDTVTQTENVVYDASEDEVLIHQIDVEGYEGMFEATGEDDPTDQFLELYEAEGGIDLTIEQDEDQIRGNRQPKVINVAESTSAVTVIENFDAGEIYVALEMDENALTIERSGSSQGTPELSDGDRFETNHELQDGWLLGDEVTRGEAAEDDDDFESITAEWAAEEEDSSFDEPVTAPPADGEEITGTTNLAPGTDAQVRVRSDEAENRYNIRDDVTVNTDGQFVAEFDFDSAGAVQDDTFTATTHQGINADDADGLITEGPDPAFFAVNDVSFDPDEVAPGDDSTLTAEISNDGEETATKEVTAEFDGEEVGTAELELDGGESQTVEFDVTAGEEDGEGTVSTEDGEASATLLVEDPNADDEDEDMGDEDEDMGDEDEDMDGEDEDMDGEDEDMDDEDAGSEDGDDEQPGFGLIVALFALLGAALLALRRQD